MTPNTGQFDNGLDGALDAIRIIQRGAGPPAAATDVERHITVETESGPGVVRIAPCGREEDRRRHG